MTEDRTNTQPDRLAEFLQETIDNLRAAVVHGLEWGCAPVMDDLWHGLYTARCALALYELRKLQQCPTCKGSGISRHAGQCLTCKGSGKLHYTYVTEQDVEDVTRKNERAAGNPAV